MWLAAILIGLAPPAARQAPAVSNMHPAISPDGRRMLFDSDRSGGGDIYVMDANGSDVRRLTTHPAMEMAAMWWDEGRSIVFQRAVPGRRPDVLIDVYFVV
jgi:Tol biopolymer transport system component